MANQNDHELRRLNEELKVLTQKVTEMTTASSTGSSGTTIWQINVLQQRIRGMEGCGGEHGLMLDEHSFASFAELKDWVRDKAVPTCGVYWDLFSIMVTMGPEQLSGQALADKEYSSSRTKTTFFLNDLLAAMTHEKPSCLYGNGGGALLTKKKPDNLAEIVNKISQPTNCSLAT
jgi:hypothetical protein